MRPDTAPPTLKVFVEHTTVTLVTLAAPMVPAPLPTLQV